MFELENLFYSSFKTLTSDKYRQHFKNSDFLLFAVVYRQSYSQKSQENVFNLTQHTFRNISNIHSFHLFDKSFSLQRLSLFSEFDTFFLVLLIPLLK